MQAHKWFCALTQEKKGNDIAHLWAHKWFFCSHNWKKSCCTFVSLQLIFCTHSFKRIKEMILHLYRLPCFFIQIGEEKNDITNLRACKWFLQSHSKIKKMILHICEPTIGFFFHSRRRRKEMVLCPYVSISGFLHFRKKWYCTLMCAQEVFFSNMWR